MRPSNGFEGEGGPGQVGKLWALRPVDTKVTQAEARGARGHEYERVRYKEEKLRK